MSEYKGDQAWTLLGRSAIRRRILGVVLLAPENRLHLREIARRVGTSAGTARRELQRLEQAGVVERTREGRQVYFSVPVGSVLYRSMAEIVRATTGAREILRRLLADLPGVKSAVIFGSYAAGMTGPKSDVDIMIVGDPDRDELTDRLEQAGRKIGREVNEVVYSAAELDDRRLRGDVFIKTVDEGPRIQVLP
ncbi:MAG: nucleotidyltransferase domain-containing protein [Chloroflexota bacterium]